jgi:hypothetical protein
MSVKILIVVLVVAGFVSSCKKNGDLVPINLTTNLNVINADANSLNVYQNGSRLNNTSILSPGSESGYMTVLAGIQTYEFKIAGNYNYLFNGYQKKLDNGQYYSLFAAGETADKLFLTNDAAPADSATKATVRFVNASAGTTNLTVSLRDSLTYTNCAFQYASAYNYIGSGISTVKVYQAGTATPLIDSTVTLTAGTLYTIFTRGTINGTGQNHLSVSLLLN